MKHVIVRGSALTESGLAALLICLMLAVVLQVVASAFDINPLITFDSATPLVGDAITLNSLLDLQWHLLVVLGLLPAGIVWWRDAHVRVDFLHQRYSPRGKAWLDLTGAVIFALPFFALILPASVSFMQRAWRADEGSRNGGLNDLWLIKAVLPFGLMVLAIYVLLEALRLLRSLR